MADCLLLVRDATGPVDELELTPVDFASITCDNDPHNPASHASNIPDRDVKSHTFSSVPSPPFLLFFPPPPPPPRSAALVVDDAVFNPLAAN